MTPPKRRPQNTSVGSGQNDTNIDTYIDTNHDTNIDTYIDTNIFSIIPIFVILPNRIVKYYRGVGNKLPGPK